MGFFHPNQTASNPAAAIKGMSLKLLHQMQCAVCPLNNQYNLKHPQMAPTGAKQPLVYILGEAPGKDEDYSGKQFVGKAGEVLRMRIPARWLDKIRWNNTVRTRPPKNRTPTDIEIECCRPSIIADIERTKPPAIFGFGNVPLYWAIGQSGVTNWTGRRIPIQVGNHACWYYPMIHPSYISRMRRFEPRSPKDYGSDLELAFALNLKQSFAEVEAGLPPPIVHSTDEVFEGLEWVTGAGGIRDVNKVLDALEGFAAKKMVGLDYETNMLRPYGKGAKILTVALASDEHTFAFPLRHREARWTPEQLKQVEYGFNEFLMEASCRKVVHSLSFEQEWSAFKFGREVIRAGTWGCSMSQAYLLDERGQRAKPDPLSLEFLGMQYFGVNIKKETGRVDRKNIDKVDLEVVLKYNAVDAKYHRLLYLAQAKRLKQEKLMQVYKHHIRRVPTMVLTQLKGVPVDQKEVLKFFKVFTKNLAEIEADIRDLRFAKTFRKNNGHDFRPSATKDVSLFLTSLGKEGGKTDEAVLEQIKHPLAELILEWRKTNKLLSTYVKPFMPPAALVKHAKVSLKEAEEISTLHPDNLLHPIISTTKTRTWRTSSEEPNEQNWPKRKNREIRGQVRPLGRNEKIVSIDYAQIQARNVAMESLDKALVKAFWDRYDIHTDWMEKIARAHPSWVKEGVKQLVHDPKLKKHYRDWAKNGIVFPSFFGARPLKVATELRIPIEVIEPLHEEFWDMFPDIKGWHNRLAKDYRRTGYVTGHSGFRRRAPVSPNELINAPIQADEAIIVCDAMARLSELDDDRYQPIMEIHDDLTFIWEKSEIEKNLEVVVPIMINTPFKWAHVVPIGIEVSVGDDWEIQKGIGEYFSDLWKGDLKLDHKDPFVGSWSDGTGWTAVTKLKRSRARLGG